VVVVEAECALVSESIPQKGKPMVIAVAGAGFEFGCEFWCTFSFLFRCAASCAFQ